MEHRCGYRRAADANVIIYTGGGLVGSATVCEVSASGARVICSLPVAVHSSVVLQISVRGPSGILQRSRVEAEVVRTTQRGFALEWTEFAPEPVRPLYAPQVQGNSFVDAPLQQKHGRIRHQ